MTFISFVSFLYKQKNILANGSNCNLDQVKLSEDPININKDDILIWADGLYHEGKSNIAFLFFYLQSKDDYIEKIVLMNFEKKVLAVRFFHEGSINEGGSPSYVVFNHINLKQSSKFFFVAQAKLKEGNKIYRYTFDTEKIERSSSLVSVAPPELVNDIESSVHKGRVSSASSFPIALASNKDCKLTKLELNPCFLDYFPRAKFTSVNPEGIFTCNVEFFIPDLDESSFVRYVFITDPVGRILAIEKRTFEEGSSQKIILKSLGKSFLQKKWSLVEKQIADIRYCPYVMVFAEHSKEGLFYSTVWLH